MSKKLAIYKKDVVKNMVDSLMDIADANNVSLRGLTINNFNTFLDDLFNDGGEVRCEKFSDLAMEYALQFGEIESIPFMDKQWDCIEQAIKVIKSHQWKLSDTESP